MVTVLATPHLYISGNLSSRTPIMYVDRGYTTNKHEIELNAKPWSELFEPLGPGLKSSLSLPHETKTRSLDQKANSTTTQDRKNNDSTTPIVDLSLVEETTTFANAADRYIHDILLLTKQS